MRVVAFVMAALGGFLASNPAHAVPERGMDSQPPMQAAPEDGRNVVPLNRLWYTSATFARINPLGLISVANVGWRRRLFDSDSVLLKDSYLHLGVNGRGSPAFGRVGLHAEIQPLAVLKAWADYEAVGYFGTFDQILSFDDPRARYDDATISSLGKSTGATGGTVFTAGMVLQAAVGPVAVRSTFQATRYDLALNDGDTVFYDQYWDRLAANEQFMFLNDLDVMAIAGKARIGARWTWSDTPGLPDDADGALAHHRVGPLFAWQFSDRGPGARFDQPTMFILTQWWLQHPYRAGAVQPQGLPLIAAGFAFRGDLLGPKAPAAVPSSADWLDLVPR